MADWDALNTRSLAEEPIVRLILDGTVVQVRLDRKATAISLLLPSSTIPGLPDNPKNPPCQTARTGFYRTDDTARDSGQRMRQDLIALARNGSAAHRLARRANALVLLDEGMSCEAIAKVLFLDDDTIRTWYRLYEADGIEVLTNFIYDLCHWAGLFSAVIVLMNSASFTKAGQD